MCGLTPPQEGSVTFDGTPVRPLKARRRDPALTAVQMVFQDPYGSLNPRRRVGTQILDGVRSADGRREQGPGPRAPEELLARVGLPASAAQRYPHEFSGGQRQRIALVETGPTAEVWVSPRHPYTQALLGAVPQPDGAGVLPAELPGDVPDPSSPPSGCHFHPRCPRAFDGCDREEPRLAGGGVACHLYPAA